ncbi:hypothetical protein ACIBEJ_51415 [Nonomuraea sp. NPDC050790]
MRSTQGKAYLELRGADHMTPTRPNDAVTEYTISWLKRSGC